MALEQTDIHMLRNEFKKKKKEINPDTDLTPFPKIDSKWITDLSIKHKAKKLLEDNIGRKLNDSGYGNTFLDTMSMTLFMKEILDKLDFINIKTFCFAKDNIRELALSHRLR